MSLEIIQNEFVRFEHKIIEDIQKQKEKLSKILNLNSTKIEEYMKQFVK